MTDETLTSFDARSSEPDVSSAGVPTRAARRTRHMQTRLILHVLGVALLLAASVGTMASQSDRFVGVYEVPPFVCDRVELVPGWGLELSRGDAGTGGSGWGALDDGPVPGGRSAICARSAGG